MRLLNQGSLDTACTFLEQHLRNGGQLDAIVPAASVFALGHIKRLRELKRIRLLLPALDADLGLLGDDADRAERSRLQTRSAATSLAQLLRSVTDVRRAAVAIPQGLLVLRDEHGQPTQALFGSVSLSTAGLGLTRINPLGMTQAVDGIAAGAYGEWFDTQWSAHPPMLAAADALAQRIESLVAARPPRDLYALILHHLLGSGTGGLDEQQVVNAATGIKNAQVWKMLYRFQRDGVVGVCDKLARYGGCILADSVGLGKTFEALAVIKYHELRNDRVLVLCPKRLSDNWTVHTVNDRRNRLAGDRFNYDVLHHTDLSRSSGKTGHIDLAQLNWGNYDLVVIDESHNFRNKKSPRKGEQTRYDRLLDGVVRAGVKTRVLMLSATPVNNRLADLRNQVAFAVAGDDAALEPHGIASIQSATRHAQQQFNAWLSLDEEDRTPSRLVDMLGFSYFQLLDLLTIARSRRHIEKYYGTAETGKFPDRLKPINVKSDLDLIPPAQRGMPPVVDLNRDISLLHLAAFTPLKALLPGKLAEYESKYATETSRGTVWKQLDREVSLVSLMRVNLFKRLESSVASFRLTLGRQLADVEAMLAKIDAHTPEDAAEAPAIADLDLDDPMAEQFAVGKGVKVLLKDMDLIKWRGELLEDRDRLRRLFDAASRVSSERDAKLTDLKAMLDHKWADPINNLPAGPNRKVIIFTAFADTAVYLYDQLYGWAKERGIESGLLTGGNENRSTLGHVRRNQADILAAFAPIAKQRAAEDAAEGELDLLIATDCVSEGQNLQDCDWLVNYDIHWNPVPHLQRFGRIDRLGSPNGCIQLVNFWPNMEIEQYLDLESRVSGRMMLLDVSATGEENLIETRTDNVMNDLPYRRQQLLKLQDSVVELEDLSAGVSIADLTLSDFRIDLADFERANPGKLTEEPPGTFAVVFEEPDLPPGYIFCLRAQDEPAAAPNSAEYPLAPYYAVHIAFRGTEVLLPHTRTRAIFDRLRAACATHAAKMTVDPDAVAAFDRVTANGRDMAPVTRALGAAVAAIAGRSEQQKAASLFSPGANAAAPAGGGRRTAIATGGFEVLAYLAILPRDIAT